MSLGSKRLESLDVLRGFDMFFILLPDPVPCIVITFLVMFKKKMNNMKKDCFTASISRRSFMGGALAAGGSAIVAGGCASPVASKSSTCGRIRFKLGIARFTFWKVELEKALSIMKEIDCHYSGLMSRTIRYDAGDAEIAAYKANLAMNNGGRFLGSM